MAEAKSDTIAKNTKAVTTFSTWKKYKKLKSKLPKCFEEFTGHSINNFSSFNEFIAWMHRPTDAASLGIFRMLFGIAMLIDIPEERGGGSLDLRFGEPKHCHFPLFNFIRPLGLPQMGVVYLIMWLGALGIALGYKFRMSCLMFVLPYWYIFLLDKPAWNNHSYLYGLTGLLFLMTEANRYCSIDYYGSSRLEQQVPYWNYFILKFQFFILYFIAGLKKMTIEWLSGYSMTNLGYHWIFIPFRTILSVEMTELLIIHWFAAIFDLTIAFWMTYEKTRLPALPFMISFHLMNSRLFTIGMFPWVCLAELPMFFKVNWPRTICYKIFGRFYEREREFESYHIKEKIISPTDQDPKKHTRSDQQQLRQRRKSLQTPPPPPPPPSSSRLEKQEFIPAAFNKKINNPKQNYIKILRIFIILLYCIIQLFLPYSHFITKGYNNWTNGMYGYSWDMMVHSYDTILTSIKVIDNNNGKTHYLEPYAFSEYDRWTKHADMAKQYAECIRKNLIDDFENNPTTLLSSKDFSIYFDIWCSMNGRFQQRVFDPRIDILNAKWSAFDTTEWILPLLNELNYMRPKINAITKDVLTWNNHSDVMFIADFPGLTMENYISPDLDNVSLTVLQGSIQYKAEKANDGLINGVYHSISVGQSLSVRPDEFHQVTTVSDIPSCYMYTYFNRTMKELKMQPTSLEYDKAILPLWTEFEERMKNYKMFFYHVGNSVMFLLYGVPMPVRIRERE